MKKQENSGVRVAIVVDFLTKKGGAEVVLRELLKAFPNATVFTAYSDKAFLKEEFPKVKVVNSFIQNLPFRKQLSQEYLLFHPLAFRMFSFFKYDVVISVSASFAKFVRPWSKKTLHIAYVLTPPRFFWLKEARSIKKNQKLSYRFYKFFMGTILEKIWQNWDRNAAKSADYIIGISETVRERIKECYGVDSDVVYPPVNVSDIKLNKTGQREKWMLYVGRLETYKGVHLAISACAVTKTPLQIVGTGSEEEMLAQMIKDYNAKGIIKMLGYRSDGEVRDMMYRCKALIFPVQDEDFGIVPVEANAAGAPVIAHDSGGARETISVKSPVTGILFKEWDAHSLADAILNFDSDNFNPKSCRAQAEQFAAEIFRYKFQNYVTDALSNSKKST